LPSNPPKTETLLDDGLFMDS